MGTRMGLSEEAKRNIANLNTAVGGALGPAYIPSYVVKAPQAVSGLDALASRIYNVINPQKGVLTAEQIAKMQQVAAAERAAQMAAGSKDAARAARAAEAAQLSGALPGEVLVAERAAQAQQAKILEAARLTDEAAKLPSAAERIQAASRAGEAQSAARVGQAARAGQYETRASALDKILDEKKAPAEKFTPMPEYDRSRGQGAFLGETELPKETMKEALDTAKEGLPKSERKGLSNDDLVEIGLRMMADPGTTAGGALSALVGSAGRAGLGALAARKEREKTAMEERKLKSEEAYRTSLGRKAEAEASYYEAQRGPAQAMQIANTAYANWEKGLSPIERLEMTPETKAAKYQFYVQQAFENLGLPLPSGVTSQMAGQAPAIPQNVTVRQTG